MTHPTVGHLACFGLDAVPEVVHEICCDNQAGEIALNEAGTEMLGVDVHHAGRATHKSVNPDAAEKSRSADFCASHTPPFREAGMAGRFLISLWELAESGLSIQICCRVCGHYAELPAADLQRRFGTVA